jgi:hypothetical protein
MSDLSEAIREEIKITEQLDEVSYTEISSVPDEDSIAPGFQAFHNVIQTRMLRQLRRVYRHHSGEELPPTGEEYLARTMDEMLNAMTHPLASAVADGMLIGQEDLFMVRKAKASGDWNALFNSAAYKTHAEMSTLTVLADPDMKEMIQHDLRAAVETISRGSGYHTCDLNNEEYLRKIWDLWILSAGSASTAFYRAATKVGAKWKERDILAGITAATEETADDDAE